MMSDDPMHVTGEIPDIPRQLRGEDRRRVPLTIYIGGVRKIIGFAVVEDDGKVEAWIDPKAEIGDALIDLVQSGTVQTMSLAFNAPPATPRVNQETGQIDWLKNY